VFPISNVFTSTNKNNNDHSVRLKIFT